MSQAITSASFITAPRVRPAAPGGSSDAAPTPAGPQLPLIAAPNPRLSLDQATGLVVMEFRSSGGETESLPTPRELTAYKRAVLSGGERPAGMESPGIRTSVGD